MSRKEFVKKAERFVGRPLEKKERQCVEIAYDAGIKDVDDAIDFADCVIEHGDNCNPYEMILDYMDIL